MSNTLPIAVIVAIGLFFLKETFEVLRRSAERRRKRSAIKELLQHEVAANYRVLNNLFGALSSTTRTDSTEERDTVVVQHSGRRQYARVDNEGFVVAGSSLPSVQLLEFNRLLPSVAELDEKLYSELRIGYEHVHELDNLVNTFVDLLTGNRKERETWFDSFRYYADSCYEEMDKGLRRLYFVLTGRDLDTKALPYKPQPAPSIPEMG